MGIAYGVTANVICDRCGKEKRNSDFFGHENLDDYGKRVTGYKKIGEQWFCPECVKKIRGNKSLNVTKKDIDIFKTYINDCMDEVAFGNSDWNESYDTALKCMELLID